MARWDEAGDGSRGQAGCLAQLDRYAARHPGEAATVARVRRLLVGEPRCFERDCYPAHITASSWIASADGRSCLLARHRKLGRWVQLGGHAAGETDFSAVALREAEEESGLTDFRFAEVGGARSVPTPPPGDAARRRGAPPQQPGGAEILDVSIHRVPPLAPEPCHWHFDIRFLLLARPGQPLRRSEEATDLRWLEAAQIETLTREKSLLRLRRKAWAELRARAAPR